MMHPRAQPSAERGTQEEDTIYQENQAYHDYGALHESLWDQGQQPPPQQQQHQQHSRVNGSIGYSSVSPTSQPRSSPIAIVRLPGDVPLDPTIRDSDDDDDDEDSEIDVVERDAIRLRKKYGDKVLAASYQPGMVMVDEEQPTTAATSLSSSKRMLKAPFLGSLSKSESFLTALPPISLSSEQETMYHYEEPPGEITSYGSLRESHQRGKFLDGPSSYREPRSGRIRRLDHRVRFPTTGNRASLSSSQQQHALSIGERIRQAQKDKESLKQAVKETTTDSDAAVGAGGGGGGTSTLSMMMDEASKNPEPAATVEEGVVTELVRGLGQGSELMTALGADDDHAYDKFDPPTMMSTSLTAFEILHGFSRSLTDPRSAQRQESSVYGSNYRLLPPTESQIREQQFQPLARSLSDPTPRGPLLPPTLQQQQQLHVPLGNENLLVGAPSTNPYWNNPYAVVDPSGVVPHDALNNPMITSSDPIHNPDTDAAFDMDME